MGQLLPKAILPVKPAIYFVPAASRCHLGKGAMFLRDAVKNVLADFLRYGGTPPLLTENQSEKKKVFFLSGKGGTPPPLNGKSAKLFQEIFSKRAKNDVFLY